MPSNTRCGVILLLLLAVLLGSCTIPSTVFLDANVTSASFDHTATHSNIKYEVMCATLAMRGGNGEADAYW